MSQTDPLTQTIELGPEDEQYLFNLVRQTIETGLAGGPAPTERNLPKPSSPQLLKPFGAFVTLEKSGALRGCVGLMEPLHPLYQAVAAMAWSAAFNDRRFPPLTRAEWPQTQFEISILGPLAVCPDLKLIVLGQHGIMLKTRGRSAVFLPQVPVEQGWDLPMTLKQLCLKAGLPPDAWQDETAVVYWYESKVLAPHN